MVLSDIIGAAGVAILLLAYLLNLLKVYPQSHWVYLSLNFLGAGLACLASIMIHFVPFIVLEGIWMGVSLFGIFSGFRAGSINK